MDRRKFLQAGSLSGMGVLLAGGADANPAEYPFRNLEETSINQLQEKMRQGALSAADITRGYLKRIEAIDRQGPSLNAVIEINPDALSIAAAMDKERKQGRIRGPLHGIPVLIKDNIDSGDKMMTTAGALALSGNKAKEDAFIIKQLRAAGAVLLGKTNLSEWANFRGNRSVSGWSSRGRQTRCPYILDRNPCGSSSGSAAAVAASLCAISIGTETNGSIVSPASVNGLAAIKPTVGLWSRSGIIPISATQDTAGPMARTLEDAVILLGALTGVDPSDTITKESTGKALTDYTPFLDKNGLRGKRIGIDPTHTQSRLATGGLFREAINILKEQGATIVEVELLKALDPIGNAEMLVLLYEFKDGVNRYLAGASARVRSIADVIAFNEANDSVAMPFFKQELLVQSNEKGDLGSGEYKDALTQVLRSRKIIADLLAEHKIDAFSGITHGVACCIDLINGDYGTGPSFNTPAAISGFPHITIPMGSVKGLPSGISFFSAAYTEPALIAMAYAYEQASRMRKAPQYRKDYSG